MSTQGNETIVLHGKNFGPRDGMSDAWYGPTDQQEAYNSPRCTVFNHTTMTCFSAESKDGISRQGFRWRVQIEDQRGSLSIDDEGKYASPEILSLRNHVNMSTQGNETIVLHGKNFGPASILTFQGPIGISNVEYVWYGPVSNRFEYRLDSCKVVSHHLAECVSLPCLLYTSPSPRDS